MTAMPSSTAGQNERSKWIKPVLIGIIALLTVGLIAIYTWQRIRADINRNTILSSGTIETDDIEIGSRLGGRVQKVLVEEGAMVQPGQALIQLEPYTIPAQAIQVEGQLAQAESQLELLANGPRSQELSQAWNVYRSAQAQANLIAQGPRQEDIAQAQANYNQANADYEQAQTRFNRYEKLYQNHVISQQEYDSTQTALTVAKERANAARQQWLELKRGSRPMDIARAQSQAKAQLSQYQLLKAGTRPEQISGQLAAVKALEGKLQELETTSNELTIKSPCQCEVNALNVDPGHIILPNQTVATLVNVNNLWVRVYIGEERHGLVHPGDVVDITVDAYPNEVFKGRVLQVASKAEFTPRNVQTQETRHILVFGVKVSIEDPSHHLRPGMPADVKFDVRQRLAKFK